MIKCPVACRHGFDRRGRCTVLSRRRTAVLDLGDGDGGDGGGQYSMAERTTEVDANTEFQALGHQTMRSDVHSFFDAADADKSGLLDEGKSVTRASVLCYIYG